MLVVSISYCPAYSNLPCAAIVLLMRISVTEDQDEAVRLQSIAKLLATMPTAHYNTLKALTGYFDR